MQQHREWQEQTALAIGAEIVSEVAAAFEYVNQVRAGRVARLK